MKHFSTFSGVEGIGQGLGEDWELVGVSEIDKYASMVLNYHYPNVKNYGDITKIDWNKIPNFDLLTGGSPCQDFSIAGKRRGLGGSRSSLAWEFIRALRSKKPRYFIWENVKGVMSSRSGWDFANLLSAFSESGYSLWWQVLNSKDFGVPQNRERIFVVGFREESAREVFFAKKDGGEIDELQEQYTNTLTARYDKSQAVGSYIVESELKKQEINQINQPKHSNDRIYGSDGIAPALNTMQGGNRQPFIVASRGRNPENPKSRKSGLPTEQMLEINFEGISNTLTSVEKDNYIFVPEATKDGFAKAKVGDSINLNNINSSTRRGRVGKQIANTLDTGMSQYTLEGNGRVRKLMPIECERLMGWKDDWTKFGRTLGGVVVEISDSQRYKMCGNGVVSSVIRIISKELFKNE